MHKAQIEQFAPLITTICQELQHGYARERILVAVMHAMESRGTSPSYDYDWCTEPAFVRIVRLSSGYSAGQAAELPKRVPWWVKDGGKVAERKWLDDYSDGAADRDVGYDDDSPLPEYLPIPGAHETSNN